jgi:hypothetical protein
VRGKVLETGRLWSSVDIHDPEVPDQITLGFEESGELSNISAHLYESRDSWDGDWDYEEMDAIDEEYLGYFTEVERFISGSLGPAHYRGNRDTEHFEDVTLGAADEVACWNYPEARIQLEFGHEDKNCHSV